MTASSLRESRLDRILIDAFGRNARQRFELIVSDRAELLIIPKIILRCRRSKDGVYLGTFPSRSTHSAAPSFVQSIELDGGESLRRYQSGHFILKKQPYLMATRKASERSLHLVTESLPQRLRPLHRLARARMRYSDLPSEEPAPCRRQPSTYSLTRYALNNRVHIVHSIADHPSVVAAFSPSRTLRTRAQARLPSFRASTYIESRREFGSNLLRPEQGTGLPLIITAAFTATEQRLNRGNTVPFLERSTTFGRSLAQLADFVRSRTSLLLHNPHPVDLFRPETLKGAASYPALQSTAFEADVVEWGSG